MYSICFVHGEPWIWMPGSGTVGSVSWKEAVDLPMKENEVIPEAVYIEGHTYTKESFLAFRDKARMNQEDKDRGMETWLL